MRCTVVLVLLPLACAAEPESGETGDATGGDASDGGSTGGPTTSMTGGTPETTAGPGGPGSSSDGGGTEAGSSEGGDSTGIPQPSGVPLFVAQGHMGRTTISCDRGQTWIHDHSLDDAVRCFDGIDCDHDEGAGTGLVFGDGAFLTTWGWGTEGNIARSTDGITWDVVVTGPTFAGLAFGDGVFVTGGHDALRSADLGVTWADPVDTGLTQWTPRGIGWAPTAGGRFVIGGGGDVGDVVVSSDGGASWWHPDAAPIECGSSIRSIVASDDTIVIVRPGGAGAELCVSHDAGVEFTAIDLGDVYFESRAMWTGEAFLVWANGAMWSSTNGDDWTSTALQPAINLGPVARDDAGNFVAVRGGWQVWYESQEFYRSTDGVTWETLAPGTFTPSHPMNHIAFGYVDATDACG